MTLLPLQQDYVTKSEFEAFRDETRERFDSIDQKFDKIDNRFIGVNDKFKTIDCRFDAIEKKFECFKDEIINTLRDDFARQTGIILETFQHNLKVSMEYMESRLDSKLDKNKFYEYMEIHFPKQSKKSIK